MIKIFPSKVHVLSYESTEVQLRVQRCTCTSGNTFESTFVRIVRKYFRTSLQCTSGSTFVLHYSIWRYVFCNTFEGTVQLFNASTVHVQLVSPLRNSKKTSKKTYVYVYWYSWQKTKKKHVQKGTREHPRAKPISFLEWDHEGFLYAPSRSRHQRRTSYAGDFAFMLSAAKGVRERRESRFRARSTIFSWRVALCACLRTVIVQSFARRRASRAEEIGFARGCSRVHFCTCFFVTSTRTRTRTFFFVGFFQVFFELRTCTRTVVYLIKSIITTTTLYLEGINLLW
jgi:hypothetical protein